MTTGHRILCYENIRPEQRDPERIRCEKKLGRELNIPDSEIRKKLVYAMEDAVGYQNQVGESYAPDITLKEYRVALESLQTHLNKILEGRGDSIKAFRRLAEILPAIPLYLRHSMDSNFWEVHRRHIPYRYDPECSAFERCVLSLEAMSETDCHSTAESLLAAVSNALENIEAPGKGGGRQEARYYIAGISCLARRFREIFPDRRISASRDTPFYNVVVFWLMHYQYDDIKNPECHINNAINACGLTF